MEKDVYIVRDLNSNSSVTEEIASNNFLYEYRLLDNSIQESNRFISKALSIPLASKIFCFEKLRIVEGRPRSIDKVYIDYNRVPGIEKLNLVDGSFYTILKREYGIETNQSEEEILVVDANERETRLLDLDKGSEVLLIKGNTYVNDHEPFEYFEVTSRSDFYRFRSVTYLR